MFKRKAFWYFMMIYSLVGWTIAIAGLVKPVKNETLRKAWKGVFCSWVYGHPLELILGFIIGKARGLSSMRIIVKTLAFGFTWWIPLKLGVIKK